MRTKWIHRNKARITSKNKTITVHKRGRYEVQSVSTGIWTMGYFPGNGWFWSVDGVYGYQPYPYEFASPGAAQSYFDFASVKNGDNWTYNWSTPYSGPLQNHGYGRTPYTVFDTNTQMVELHGDAIITGGDMAGQHYPGYDADARLFTKRTATCNDGSPATWDSVEQKWYCPISTL